MTIFWESRLTHLGVVLDKLRSDSASVESRIKKYFAAVNSVVSRFEGDTPAKIVIVSLPDPS